jgi:hypothetical protein
VVWIWRGPADWVDDLITGVYRCEPQKGYPDWIALFQAGSTLALRVAPFPLASFEGKYDNFNVVAARFFTFQWIQRRKYKDSLAKWKLGGGVK